MTRLAMVKAERDAANRRADILHMALACARNEKPDVVERVNLPDGRYVLEAYRLDGPSGGFLIETYYSKVCDQRPSTDAYLFEEYYQAQRNRIGASFFAAELAKACERIVDAHASARLTKAASA
jgi:hypothetical protein